MNIPTISVILPAYNCGFFLRESIDSILKQTFADFELIIVNDGSTDTTKTVVQSFRDDRIIYLENEKNQGLIFTLNKGIDHARGKYIARMDGDDISLPERLRSQLDFFTQHPEARVLATVAELIDEKGNKTGYWEAERRMIDPRKIRVQLPKDNCIAHPTVMCETTVLKKYRYNPSQKHTEDYDLWLRLESDNILIYKIGEPLLRYRMLKSSITRQTQQNVFWKNAKTKLWFTGQQLSRGKLNGFIAVTFFYGLLDLLKGLAKEIKKVFRGRSS